MTLLCYAETYRKATTYGNFGAMGDRACFKARAGLSSTKAEASHTNNKCRIELQL